MIVDMVRGDILTTSNRNIIFAVNAEGINDFGIAGAVSKKYWPELAKTGGNKIGEVLRKKVGKKTFHAIVCHSLNDKNGWEKSHEIIEKAINEMPFPDNVIASVVFAGTNKSGILSGAPQKIFKAFEKTKKQLVVYNSNEKL